MKFEILEIIQHHDIGNRIKSNQICKELGWLGIQAEPSQIRGEINSLRVEGHPIGSDSRGYFLAKNQTELSHTKAQIISRVEKMVKAVKGLDKCFQIEPELFA